MHGYVVIFINRGVVDKWWIKEVSDRKFRNNSDSAADRVWECHSKVTGWGFKFL